MFCNLLFMNQTIMFDLHLPIQIKLKKYFYFELYYVGAIISSYSTYIMLVHMNTM